MIRSARGRSSIFAAGCAVAIIVGPNAAFPNEPVGLAPNPSFEESSADGLATGWRPETGEPQVDGAMAHTGRRSLRASAESGRCGAWASTPIALEMGRTYEVSGWIRADGVVGTGPDAGAYLGMRSLPVALHTSPMRGTRDWRRVSFVFTATSPSDEIRCALDGEGVAGTAWFDDVSLTAVAATALPSAAVERYGPGYRYGQAGWTFLHIEGEPYERGYQHGYLMSKDIAEFVGRSARDASADSPKEAWKWIRLLSDSMFLRGYPEELLLEMKGIADGAAARGAKWDGRPVDLVDVVALNAWTELMYLPESIANTPNGLEGRIFKEPFPKPDRPARIEKCSAFAATGPATADGKIVIGHITMFGLYLSKQFNVMIDVKPAKGHRFVMQAYPAAIQSGMDWYMNDAGVVVTETTIGQGPFEIAGTPETARIREAAQYAESIDDVVRILSERNNGLYANEWLIGDVKTNEIAMLELGTKKTKLWRSSKDEWPGGTPGFYWGCNNTKDATVMSEYVPDPKGKPDCLVFCPADRDVKWHELYRRFRGRIDVHFGTLAFSTPPVCGSPSLDAKVTTGDMARKLMTWAHFGRPNGRAWEPTDAQKRQFDDITPLVSSGWTVVRTDAPFIPPPEPPAVVPPAPPTPAAPVAAKETEAKPGDAPTGESSADEDVDEDDAGASTSPHFVPPWRGTVLPDADADLWLAAGWARYYGVAEAERRAADPDGRRKPPSPAQAKKASKVLHELLGAARSDYSAAVARGGGDRPLSAIAGDFGGDAWYRIAEAKGALVLHELRRAVGDEAFFKAMTECGERFAGKALPTPSFRASVEAAAGKDLGWFFDQWLGREGAPRVRLEQVKSAKVGDANEVEATLVQDGTPYRLSVEVVLTTEKGKERQTVSLDGPSTAVRFKSASAPKTLTVDPDGDHVWGGGPHYATTSFERELDRTLIVFGTASDEAANRYAAELLRDHYLKGWWQRDLPVRRDVDVTEAELKGDHLIVVGRPETNSVAARFASAMPVAFKGMSFEIAGKPYAQGGHSVIAAAANPLAPARCVVFVAGLGPEATVQAAQSFAGGFGYVVFDGKKRKASGWPADAAMTHSF